MKKLITPLAVTGLLSACASHYELPEGSPTANLTVRSPQGSNVAAHTFSDPQDCTKRQTLVPNNVKKSKASKTYDIEAGKESTFAIELQGISAGGQSCFFTVRFPVEEQQHYVVTMVSDEGKRVCNNKIVNYLDKGKSIPFKLIPNLTGRGAIDGTWCRDESFVVYESKDGRFKTASYQNTLNGNQFGVFKTTKEQTER